MFHLILTIILVAVVYVFCFVALALRSLASWDLSMILDVLGDRTWLELVWVTVGAAAVSWRVIQPEDSDL